jgi:hypothetical protein
MALSEDQRALLRLLMAGDTYEQVADVLGTSPSEVRGRAAEAADLLESDPEPELPPKAVRDRLAQLEGGPAGAAVSPTAAAAGRFAGWRRWIPWIAAGVAVAIALVVVAVARNGGGDNTTSTTQGDQEDAVSIQLAPVGGAKASGVIRVVRVGDQPAVDLDIQGLTPTGPGQSYVLWFIGAGGRSLPVAFRGVGPDGRLQGRAPIASAATGLLPSFDTAELALVRQRQAAAVVRQAARSGILPEAVGTPVMRGALHG